MRLIRLRKIRKLDDKKRINIIIHDTLYTCILYIYLDPNRKMLFFLFPMFHNIHNSILLRNGNIKNFKYCTFSKSTT